MSEPIAGQCGVKCDLFWENPPKHGLNLFFTCRTYKGWRL